MIARQSKKKMEPMLLQAKNGKNKGMNGEVGGADWMVMG